MDNRNRSERVLYIAAQGRDSWSGRRPAAGAGGSDGPFATLERARDEIRRIKQTEGLPPGGLTVELGGGSYLREQPFVLDARDSGSAQAPVVYRARAGERVRLLGGRILEGFAPVRDPAALSRLPPEARGKVLQIDLRARGITHFGEAGGGGLELFFEDRPMTLARWPQRGFVEIAGLVGGDPVEVRGTVGDRTGKFLYAGERPARWTGEKDAWVHGYWFWDWSDQRHRIESIDVSRRVIAVEPPYHTYGYRVGQWYYAFNLLSELDTPGEWYLDRETGILYFWPPGPIEEGRPAVSLLDTLVEMEGVEHLHLRGMSFEVARGTALVVAESAQVQVEECAFANLGGWAVRVAGGGHCAVRGCELRGMGKGGIFLSGGERKTLEAAGHLAADNHIHHYSRWDRMYNPGISLEGVGCRAAHNLIHDAPHMAIFFSGNDHLIEYNEIHHVCLESNDAGAIYAGRDWTMRGTLIRYNYLYEIQGFEGRGCVGVYLDDMFCGTTIFGNLFYRVRRAAFIGGGRDCTIENNIFVECDPALHIDARAMNWAAYHVGTTMKERLEAMPCREAPWAERYPELPGLWEDEPAAPRGNVVARNICQGGRWDEVLEEARPYVVFRDNLVDGEAGFAGRPPADFRLRDDAPALALGFRPIPIERIGLRRQ